MQSDGPAKPQPQPTEVSEAFWNGTREGRLRLQQCANCGKIRHYPRPICDRCYSLDVQWIDASGRGTVHSWTVAHHAYHPAFKSESPYVLLTVDLEEGVRQMGRLEGDQAASLRVGAPVALGWTPTTNGYALPNFRIVGAEDARSGTHA